MALQAWQQKTLLPEGRSAYTASLSATGRRQCSQINPAPVTVATLYLQSSVGSIGIDESRLPRYTQFPGFGMLEHEAEAGNAVYKVPPLHKNIHIDLHHAVRRHKYRVQRHYQFRVLDPRYAETIGAGLKAAVLYEQGIRVHHLSLDPDLMIGLRFIAHHPIIHGYSDIDLIGQQHGDDGERQRKSDDTRTPTLLSGIVPHAAKIPDKGLFLMPLHLPGAGIDALGAVDALHLEPLPDIDARGAGAHAGFAVFTLISP